MKRLALPALFVALTVPAIAATVTARAKKPRTPFEAAKIIFEFNATDQDLGIQLFIDAEAWKTVAVLDPDGHKIFEVAPKGSVKPLGGSELLLSSAAGSRSTIRRGCTS